MLFKIDIFRRGYDEISEQLKQPSEMISFVGRDRVTNKRCVKTEGVDPAMDW